MPGTQSACWIAHVFVMDEDAYAKEAAETVASHGGEFVARGGRYVQMETQI